jgi:O-methyltransferase domain/Dimerisation domain
MSAERPTPDRLLAIGQGFWAAKVLLSAVELGVFTLLAAGPLDGDDLRHRLHLHPKGTPDFFDALVALRLLERDAAGRYSNAPDADCFLDGAKPDYMGGYFGLCNDRQYCGWAGLTEALRTGEPLEDFKAGRERFLALYADPAKLSGFLKGMTGGALPVARAIAVQFPWRDFSTFMDIGTAEGCLAVQVALAHGHITGGGFDLPPVGPHFDRFVRRHDLQHRLAFVGGSFLVDDLPPADVLVLGRVLHNWDLETKRLLVAKAYAALPSGGCLVVYDRIIDDARRVNVDGLLASLNMLVMSGVGFDYTGAECQAWMREAGFAETRVEPLVISHSMVIGRK